MASNSDSSENQTHLEFGFGMDKLGEQITQRSFLVPQPSQSNVFKIKSEFCSVNISWPFKYGV